MIIYSKNNSMWKQLNKFMLRTLFLLHKFILSRNILHLILIALFFANSVYYWVKNYWVNILAHPWFDHNDYLKRHWNFLKGQWTNWVYLKIFRRRCVHDGYLVKPQMSRPSRLYSHSTSSYSYEITPIIYCIIFQWNTRSSQIWINM